MLGIKQLAWDSVQIPMIMPKPDLVALTGGYRKTPVLQVGADVYCDTNCIARELERRHPAPTLFPDGGAGVPIALAAWGDRYFEPGAGLAMTVNEGLPADLIRDRRAFFSHMDFDAFKSRVPHLYAQLLAHTALVEEQDRKSTRLNSSHGYISYAVFCLKKKTKKLRHTIPLQTTMLISRPSFPAFTSPHVFEAVLFTFVRATGVRHIPLHLFTSTILSPG